MGKHVELALDTLNGQQAARARILAAGIGSELAERAWQMIEDARQIVILAHEHPDPDALGSALGLAFALEPHGKECVIACADAVPANYDFLPGWERVVSALPHENFDLVIALDAGELSRYGSLYTRHQSFFDRAPILNVDHHITSVGCGRVNIIDPVAAATAELLTVFLLNRGAEIGTEAAKCLLAGIITDTRSFEFDATTARTLTAGAYLVGKGAIPDAIIKPMYRMKPLAKARLWGLALQTMESAAGGRVVWAAIRREMLTASGATTDMDDGLASFLIDIEGVGIAALFKEQTDGSTKVSMRSVAPYDAAKIAAHFGGGGHMRAAGCTLATGVDEAVRTLMPHLVALIEGV
ncbi:MAG TPA: bifunctional oligoribonuclease/PAP phosphatase NrnA [Ktedonobacterales bacterium]|nr:bifunctional oligoribonuclease/PAP phosphatase NrnA [Ktedonobacterales bacterium]